jgi:hypothetical protein
MDERNFPSDDDHVGQNSSTNLTLKTFPHNPPRIDPDNYQAELCDFQPQTKPYPSNGKMLL